MSYQVCDPLSHDEYEALKSSIAEIGIQIPVVYDEGGNIIDGHHRLRAYYELKAAGKDVNAPSPDIRRGLSEAEKRNLARTLNAVRRQMSREQRNKLIVAMREDGMSYRQIGEAVGVGKSTVERIASGVPNGTPKHITGADGKQYPATKPVVVTPDPEPVAYHPLPADVSEMPRTYTNGMPVLDLPGSPETSAHAEPKSEQAPPVSRLAVHHSSETPEHYTPSEIVEAVVDVLGVISLDPCSNSQESPNVPSVYRYTKEDDGLAREWVGTVYMNPPYGRGIDQWVSKLVESYASGGVLEAIALLPARPDTQWWQILRDYPCCFITGRLKFIGNDDPAPFPSAVFYLGENMARFYDRFSSFGDIWTRVDEHWFTE